MTAVQHLRTLLSLVLTNSEVRKLLSDFSLIGRDLLAISAQKAAGHIAPDPEALARVDESAPQDQFITEGGRVAGPNETPVLEARVPGTDVRVKQHPREDEARIRGEDGRERPVGQVRDHVVGEANRAKEGALGHVDQQTGGAVSGQRDPRDLRQSGMDRGDAKNVGVGAAQRGLDQVNTQGLESEARGILGDDRIDRARGNMEGARDEAQGAHGDAMGARDASTQEETEAKKRGVLDRMRGVRVCVFDPGFDLLLISSLQDTLTDRVPHEHRDRVERGKKFLTEEYFPEERRDQFIYRGKKVRLLT